MNVVKAAYGCPVNAVDRSGAVQSSFPSRAAAARAMGVYPTAIRTAVERGWRCRGLWWRYADMPASCQPLKVKPLRHRVRLLVEVDGKPYKNIADAARGLGLKRSTLWKRLMRDGNLPSYMARMEAANAQAVG